MRKTILGGDPALKAVVPAGAWLDLTTLAQVEISSEDPEHPVEGAFAHAAESPSGEGSKGGWQAAVPGPQTLRLHFDAPQRVRRVLLQFRETDHERMQEFSLHATLADGHTREIVRQQWSFSPGGSVEEQENYAVELEGVKTLTLWIDPDRGRDRYPASLEAFRVEG
ncbi:MAG TPA: hypothetical protein VGD62_01980 [Acidobacteriaceae bacterium]